jgi:hypothetical protein
MLFAALCVLGYCLWRIVNSFIDVASDVKDFLEETHDS